MPTYEYKCKKCEHDFEIFQNMSDDKLDKCPKCGGKISRVIFGGTGIIFKGSGFYVNDYAKKTPPEQPSCGKETTCCGKKEPCSQPACKQPSANN